MEPLGIESERLFGIAKKINAELEALPLTSHATIVRMLQPVLEHRVANSQIQQQQDHEARQRAQQFGVSR